MKQLLTLAAALLLFLTSCDLNDDDENGTFSLYFRAKIDGVDWAATPQNIGASLDNSSGSDVIRIHGDAGSSGEYFYIKFPPLLATDTTITSNGFANRMEFHTSGQTWVSVNGNLVIHQAGSPTHREYSGTFSGSFFNAGNGNTITVTNGEYLAQGVF